jgi:hypothetical protein
VRNIPESPARVIQPFSTNRLENAMNSMKQSRLLLNDLPNETTLDSAAMTQVAGGKPPQNQDKMGNFEIQGLMSAFNEARTLSIL